MPILNFPFHKSLPFSLEQMSWKPMTLTSAATTYFSAIPGTTTNVIQPKHILI
jgi:hypothetical protein